MTDIVGPLPASGPGREILLKALRAYRESCQPPELTPDCPFFTWTANGPACGEECADLLAQYGCKDPQDRFDLGGGIVLIRQNPTRRPRRGPAATDRPFDARQVYLSDENRPHADRRTVALIMELADLISTPPTHSADPEERSYDIRAARDQLASRDFDVDSLIRYGIGPAVAMSVIAYVMLPMMREDERLRPMMEGMNAAGREPDHSWLKFFDEAYLADTGNASDDLHGKASYAIQGFLDRVRAWVTYGDLDNIVKWSVPAVEAESHSDESDVSESSDRRIKARWALERFTLSFVRDWGLDSLHLEWLYLHGHIPAPCSSTAMAERRTNATEVAAAIAEKTSRNWREKTSETTQSRASEFVSVAAAHLRDGKPELAAAIFEALTYVDPNDAEALNNYGFCLIAVDPSTAVEVLERASSAYKDLRLLTLANRVLALHLMGRDEQAYALAMAEATRMLPTESGMMWLLDDNDTTTLSNDFIDVREYLNGIIAHIDTGCVRRRSLPPNASDSS